VLASEYRWAGGFDLKWDLGKASDFGQTANHVMSTDYQADIDADNTRNELPNLIANINHRLWAPTYCAANLRGGCDRAGGFDLKWHLGKASDFGQTAEHVMSTDHQADINADYNRNAIPNLIANINDRLWTYRTPTTAV